jgi:magnesium transporter
MNLKHRRKAMLRRYELIGGKVKESENVDSPILVYINPDENEKKYLINEQKLDEHTLNSALDPDELSRLEFEPEHAALIVKRPKNYSNEDNFLFKVSSSGYFLFQNRLIIVLPEDISIFDVNKIFIRITTVQSLLLKIFYRYIFHFLEHLKVISMISDSIEHKINESLQNKYLLNLFILEKSLVYYLNAINGNGAVIDKIKHNIARFSFSQEDLEFLDDVQIENTQCYRQAEIYSNILASLMDARASIVGNNLNMLMKVLNVITIGIMVPTFVVSAFSMNVTIPLQHHPQAFWIILLMGAVSVFGFMAVIRYKKW